MIKILLTLSLYFSFANFLLARPSFFQLRPQESGLMAIKGKLKKVSRLCPQAGACRLDGTNVEVDFILYGCLDRLGPVSYMIKHKANNKVDIYLSALNIKNERSDLTTCTQLPYEVISIPIPNSYYKKSDIKLRFLGVDPVVAR